LLLLLSLLLLLFLLLSPKGICVIAFAVAFEIGLLTLRVRTQLRQQAALLHIQGVTWAIVCFACHCLSD